MNKSIVLEVPVILTPYWILSQIYATQKQQKGGEYYRILHF